MKNKFKENIEVMLNSFNLKTIEEKELLNDTLIKLSNLEKLLFSLDNKHPCIAYHINPYLCDGTGKEKTIKSHTVEDNQLRKIQKDFLNFFDFSFSITENLLNGKIKEMNTSAGRFVGFCSECEKEFSNHIDSDMSPDIYKMALTKYRHIGKMIFILKEIVFIFEKINNNEINEQTNYINKEGLSLLLQYISQYNLQEYIDKKQVEIINLTIVFNELKLYWNKRSKQENVIHNGQNLNYFYSIKTFKTNSFVCSAQSLINIPLHFIDLKCDLFLFLRFQYDNINKNTICHIFGGKYYLDLLFSKISHLNPTDDEIAELFFIMAIKNNQNFYFPEITLPMITKAHTIIETLMEYAKQVEYNLNIYQELEIIINILRT